MEAVKQTLTTWLKAITSGGSDGVMTLYMDNAILIPATSPGIFRTPDKRLAYFENFTAKENLQATINEIHTRVHGDIALNTGIYTFSFKQDGVCVAVPVCFSFVYKKTSLGWMIIDHHETSLTAGQ